MFPFKATKSLNLICGVYRILHKPTGLSYVGSSTNLRVRVNTHRGCLLRRQHQCKPLQDLWDRGNPNDFTVEILEECDLRDSILDTLENDWKVRLGENTLNPRSSVRITSSKPAPIELSVTGRHAFEKRISAFHDTNVCWDWYGPTKNGRGVFGGKKLAAPRVSYFYHYGIDPGDKCVSHTCNNKLCVNPHHLVLGYYSLADMDWDKVREIRRLHAETELTLRELGEMFGFSDTGLRGIVNNTVNEFYDPDYVTSKRGTGPRGEMVSILGVKKTLKDWAADPRCKVGLKTLRQRYREGKTGVELLAKKQPAGRPAQAVSNIRKERCELICRLDAEGLNYKEINEALAGYGWKQTGPKEIASLTESFVVAEEALESLCVAKLYSEWSCQEKAKELKLPLSVVLRFRAA